MRRLILAGLLLAVGAPAAAAAAPRPGWVKAAKSLLYYDAEGRLSGEIGLGRWEETGAARVRVKRLEAGVSPNARFAWTLDKREVWNSAKTRLLEVKRLLRFYGGGGKELWNDSEPDLPPDGPPLVFSDDGETCLLALRRQNGWFASARSYLDDTLFETGPFPGLEALQLSPNGLYGAARWNDLEQGAAHAFIDVKNRKRRDIASSEFLLGRAAIDDAGEVKARGKTLRPFTPAPESP
ncbi:MAG: hypothetical protein PHF00_00890 [Elusimicrobia bacterium]|nr:hypothetical protein [Elusimicrobiota bacterium]